MLTRVQKPEGKNVKRVKKEVQENGNRHKRWKKNNTDK